MRRVTGAVEYKPNCLSLIFLLFQVLQDLKKLVSSIGQTISVVNKGRHVTLKYFILLRKIIKEHRLFTEVLKKHKFNLDWYEIR